MEEARTKEIDISDKLLPDWFAIIMGKNGIHRLTLELNEKEIHLSHALPQVETMYLEEDGTQVAAVLLCTLFAEDVPVTELLKVNGEQLLTLPPTFSFLEQTIKGLDVCMGLIVSVEGESDYTEQLVVTYANPISLVPNLLELERLYLRVLRRGISSIVHLGGTFMIGKDTCIEILVSLSPSGIKGELSAIADSSLSFMDFLKWIAKEVQWETVMGWLEDGNKFFDAAIEGAGFTIDRDDGTISDYYAEMKITLFGFELMAAYYGRDGILKGSTWKDSSIRVKTLIEKVAGSQVNMPKEIGQMEISACSMEIGIKDKSWCFDCSIKDVLEISGLLLEQVSIVIKKREDFSIMVSGIAKISDIWQIAVSFDYKDSEHYSLFGSLNLVQPLDFSSVPFLCQVLPDEIQWNGDGAGFTFREGKLTDGVLNISMVRPKEKKNTLEKSYIVEKTNDGEDVVRVEEKVPENGAIREGDGIRWKEVHKKFGPVAIERVGILFQESRFYAGIAAALQLGPAELRLMGFMAGYDLAEKKLCYELDGIGIGCHTKSFVLSGYLCKDLETTEDVQYSYSGAVNVKVASWELGAIGSYAMLIDNTTSLFVFMNCRVHLQVMPAFTITGIMGGMGINRSLRIPKAEEMDKFPLLQKSKASTMPQELNDWMKPIKGEYWAAAGIHFEVCGIIEGRMLLSLIFGSELQAALVGSAQMTLPKGASKEDAYAYIRILLSAILRPETGIFYAEAVIAEESFLLDKNCHLFGKAACAVWFGKHEQAGDFVLTIGGYHNDFRVPDHYPRVERVGFSWQIDEHLSAKGSAYLAVTPSCVMAGGDLEFLFTLGELKAWFVAYANIFMNWHPFFFNACIGVEAGVSYRLNLLFCHKTIKASIGANLNMWGPPLGGRMKIQLAFISFTVSFGKTDKSNSSNISWDELRKTLVAEEKVHKIEPVGGVRNQKDEKQPWISEDGKIQIDCKSAIPKGKINIRPMGLSSVESHCKIEIVSPENKRGNPEEFGMECHELRQKLPTALWGEPLREGVVPEDSLVEEITGYKIQTGQTVFLGEIQIKDYREAFVNCLHLPNPLTDAESEQDTLVYGEESGDIFEKLSTVDSEEMEQKRATICECLHDYYCEEAGNFGNMRKQRYHLYTDRPRIRRQKV